MSWVESQVDERARLDRRITERAYMGLASSVMGAYGFFDPHANETSQADMAARACLQYIGVNPGDVPKSIKGIEDRIDWMCRPTGTMHRDVRLDDGWYKRAYGAMMGRLDTGDLVALLPAGGVGYRYLDPKTGKKVRVNARTARHIDQSATVFYKPLPQHSIGLPDFLKFIAGVFDFRDYLLVLLASVASALIGLVPAVVNKVAFGTVVPSGQAYLVAPLAALLIGMAISTTLITACRNLVMSRVTAKLDVVTEAATFSRILTLPPSFFSLYSSGDLASRVSSVTALAQQLVEILLGTALSALLSLVYVVQIWFMTPTLAPVAFFVTLGQALMTILVAYATSGYERMSMDASAKQSGVVTALLNGVQKIKLAGAEDRAFARWASGYSSYAQSTYNRPALLTAIAPIVSLMGVLGNILIYYLAGSGDLTIASYMAFSVTYGQVTAAIMQLASAAGTAAQINPLLKLVEPILQAEPEVSEIKPGVESLSGSIEVSGVSFRYEERAPYVLRDLSFRVRSGEYLAIVGRSGCGKSTIMRLLLGFEKPERGSILYGPHNVQKVDLRSLRQHIGVVMQDGKLFLGDIANNISVSTPLATEDDIWRAAEIAGVADDIRKMPMGMQTIVTEGSGGLSGGQRQRIMIARAVCGKRKILMFDEATSALDNVTQRHVADALATLKCTRIVIAHRLSTVRHCDRILVIDDGHVAEEGSYDELMQRNGLFAELVRRQQLAAD